MAQVTSLWRHPIKSHGREQINAASLQTGEAFPWDRYWAVTHDAKTTEQDAEGWASCHHFMIGTRTPGLAGLWADLDENTRRVTLKHQDLGEICISPENPDDVATFLDWISPLCPDDRAKPNGIIAAKTRGMTDTKFPSISIMNTASHQAVRDAGGPAEPERWRGNIWVDGIAPWAEFDLMGKTIRIGDATLMVRERIERCRHTEANPVTGKRDTETLAVLESTFGHKDFGIYAEVVDGGDVNIGDKMRVLS